MICGYPKRIFGALAVVSADNLGSLALGGYRIPKKVTNSFVTSDVIVVFYSFWRKFSSFEMKLTINFIALK